MNKLTAIFVLILVIGGQKQQSKAAVTPPCKDGATRTCGIDMGECTLGKQTCNNGRWSDCDGRKPKKEVCDLLDNNCDGDIDEGCECVDGSTRQCGIDFGECTVGVQPCINGMWSSCNGVMPAVEIEDRLDNDCDGAVDEDFACKPGEVVPCERYVNGKHAVGKQSCGPNKHWGSCKGLRFTGKRLNNQDGPCGDGVCSDSETPASCEVDCGSVCGDGYCSLKETLRTCPRDCKVPPPK